MLAYKAVIFDLDGTLLDTLEDIGTAANAVLKRFGRDEYPMATYKTLVGDGVSVLFQRAWAETKTDADLLSRTVAAFQEEYAVQWNKRSKPYDGIESLLNRLNESELTWGFCRISRIGLRSNASNITSRTFALRRSKARKPTFRANPTRPASS